MARDARLGEFDDMLVAIGHRLVYERRITLIPGLTQSALITIGAG